MLPHRPSTRLPAVLTPEDLSLAELSSARLDGEVYALGSAWCPVDEIDGPVNRARAVGLLVPVTAVAERATAAWIFGLTAEPSCHELRLDSRARRHVSPSVHLRIREVRDPLTDTLELDGVHVTTPLRTAIDLALYRSDRHDNTAEARLLDLLASLLRYSGCRDDRAAQSRLAPLDSANAHRARARFRAVQNLFDDEALPSRR
jgi:hypothetical protein